MQDGSCCRWTCIGRRTRGASHCAHAHPVQQQQRRHDGPGVGLRLAGVCLRGRGRARPLRLEGVFNAWYDDSEDGSDLIDWIAGQAWSMAGGHGRRVLQRNEPVADREAEQPSPRRHSRLRRAKDSFRDLVRWNGVPKLDLIYTWMMAWTAASTSHGPVGTGARRCEAFRSTPWTRSWAGTCRCGGHGWRTIRRAPGGNRSPCTIRTMASTFLVQNVTGWFDGQVQGTSRHFAERGRDRRSGRPRPDHRTLAPRSEPEPDNRPAGLRPDAIIDLDGLRDAWLDHRLLGKTPARSSECAVFLRSPTSGGGRRVADSGTRFTEHYLASAETPTRCWRWGLSGTMPGSSPPDAFTYDPAIPCPRSAAARPARARASPQGSVDNRAVETREDVLVYTGPCSMTPWR